LIAERREASRQLERKMGLNGSSVVHLARQPRQKIELISASLARFPGFSVSGREYRDGRIVGLQL
jgi:hypothetical protein